MDEALTRNLVEAARVITEEAGGFWSNQLANVDQISAHHPQSRDLGGSSSINGLNYVRGHLDGNFQIPKL